MFTLVVLVSLRDYYLDNFLRKAFFGTRLLVCVGLGVEWTLTWLAEFLALRFRAILAYLRIQLLVVGYV